MTDEIGETFVPAYVEFRNKLSVFLDAKRLNKFEKQLTKGAKFVYDYLDWVAEGVSGDILLDLHYEYKNGDADLTPATEKAMATYESLLAIVEDWAKLVELCKGKKKVTKNFVKYRKQVRKLLDEQAQLPGPVTSELKPEPAVFQADFIVDLDEPEPVATTEVNLDVESEHEPEPPTAA